MSSKASMTIMIKGPWSVEKAIETKEPQSGPYLSGGHGFDQARVLSGCEWYEWVDDRKTVGQGASVSISAKTGTAETTVDGGKQAINTNVVAYAPSNNPKIAVAVVFPHNTNLQATVSHSITRDIINLYNQKHPMN